MTGILGRWDNLPLRYKTLVVLAVPMVPLLILAAAVVVSATEERAAQQWVAHTLEVKEQIATDQGCFGPNNEYRKYLNNYADLVRQAFGDSF